MLFSFAESHIGQRKVNEDSYLMDKELGLYIVADGVGGLDKGEVASRIACDVIKQSIISGATLEDALSSAHLAIVEEIKNDENKQGMATTVVALLFKNNTYQLAWVGDSRAYLWNNELKLITKDDSYVELLLENGHISIADLETHPDRNVISQALGIKRKNIKINTNSGTLEPGQILLICSDGLYTVAKEMDIITTLTQTSDLKEISQSLVATSVKKGGRDNITLISLKSDGDNNNSTEVITPKIYREFDRQTGQVKGIKPNQDDTLQDLLNSDNSINETIDSQSYDQTEITDMDAADLSLLDSSSMEDNSSSNTSPTKSNNYMLQLTVFTVVFFIAFLVFQQF